MNPREDGVYIPLAERRRDILEKLLQERKGYTRKHLLQLLTDKTADVRDGGIYALNTLINDMNYLKKNGAEIKKEKREARGRNGRTKVEFYYLYANPKFTYKKQILDPETLASIKVVASIIKQIPGIQMHQDLKDIYQTLIHHSEEDSEEQPFIMFDTRDGVTGLHHVPKILRAVLDKGVISFEYKPFTSTEPTSEVVHPYLLKEYKSRWYLIGLNDKRKEIQNYGLDRIKSRNVTMENKRKFEMLTEFNPVEYFKNIVGVSIRRNAVPEKIILKLINSRAAHLESAPLHPSQTLISEDSSTKTYTFDLIPNYELTNWILSYGSEIEVLEPESLRSEVSKIALEMSKTYFQ